MKQIDWSQVLSGLVIGVVLGVGGAVFSLNGRVAVLEERAVPASPKTLSGSTPGVTSEEDLNILSRNPDSLRVLIVQVQHMYVRESYGDLAGQNFSDDDLKRSRFNRIPSRIADSLRSDPSFLGLILGLKGRDAATQQRVLREGETTARPTWRALGRISKDGQTAAGNAAELEIAKAIADLARDLLRRPTDDLKKLASP